MSTTTTIRPPRTMREVFNTLPEGTLVQLIENNLVMSPAPLDRHQVLVLEIAAELHALLKSTKKGTARIAPYDVYFDTENIFQPDIIFISNERKHLIQEDGLHGAPDMVIEILSPSTAHYDLQEKKSVYERFGVTEYWVVDPATNSTTGFYLVKDEYHAFFKGTGSIESKLLEWQVKF
jgi:Uma2 family endonuclease